MPVATISTIQRYQIDNKIDDNHDWSNFLSQPGPTHADQSTIALRVCSVSLCDIGEANPNGLVENNVKCECCDQQFACNGLRDLHVHAGLPSFVRCSKCPTFFTQNAVSCAHRRLHKLPPFKQFECSHCGRIFAKKDEMVAHIHVNRKADILPVNIKEFYQPLEQVQQTYECDICGRIFHMRFSIERHLKEHLSKKLHCPICDRKFYAVKYLKRHAMVHTGEKPFECSVCGKGFADKMCVKVHMRTHTGERPFICPICGKTFISLPKLTLHDVTVHLKARNYACKTCDKRFFTNAALRIHTRSQHTSERPYVCPICNMTFATNGGLWKHSLTHKEKKQHKCKICDKTFTSTTAKRTHEQVQHKAIWTISLNLFDRFIIKRLYLFLFENTNCNEWLSWNERKCGREPERCTD